jgi:hypothetical protein
LGLAAAIVTGIVVVWLAATLATTASHSPPKPAAAVETQVPSIHLLHQHVVDSGESLTDMNVRKNARNVGLYDATERSTGGRMVVQHVGDLQIEQAVRMRDNAKQDPDGMPNVLRPKFLRTQ